MVPIELYGGFKVAGDGNKYVIWLRAKNLFALNDSIVLSIYVKFTPVVIHDLSLFVSKLSITLSPTKNRITIKSRQIEAILYYKISDISVRTIDFNDFTAQTYLLNFELDYILQICLMKTKKS